MSADGLNWRLKFKDGIKWHDGTPFTAEDVKFTIELINNPDFRAGRRAGHELVRDIQVVSPTELTWRLEKPYAPYPAILSWTFIVPKHILGKEADPNTSSFNTAPIGTGSFKWAERVPGDHITLTAFEDYFGEGPYLERLIFKYIPDMTVLYTQFQTGDVDYTGIQGISPDHYEEAKALAGRVVTPVPQPFIENIAFNLGLPMFQEQAVRDALYLAMDKQGIIESIYYGLPTPTESFLPKRELGLQPQPAGPQLRSREGQADPRGGRLEAGQRRRAREERSPARVHQLDHRRQPYPRAGAAAAAADLGRDRRQDDDQQPAAGRDVGRLLDDVEVRQQRWSASASASARTPTPTTSSPASRSAPRAAPGRIPPSIRAPRSTSCWRRVRPTVDQAKRKEIYSKMQEHTRHDLPYLPIFQYKMVEGIKEGLQNFTPNVAVQENSWNAGQWYWAS